MGVRRAGLRALPVLPAPNAALVQRPPRGRGRHAPQPGPRRRTAGDLGRWADLDVPAQAWTALRAAPRRHGDRCCRHRPCARAHACAARPPGGHLHRRLQLLLRPGHRRRQRVRVRPGDPHRGPGSARCTHADRPAQRAQRRVGPPVRPARHGPDPIPAGRSGGPVRDRNGARGGLRPTDRRQRPLHV